jgi:zinc protease
MMTLPRPLAFAFSLLALVACAHAAERGSSMSSGDLAATTSGAAAPGAGSTALPFDPSVRRGTLDNGLTYFVRANRRPEQRAELRLVVKAGSILEDSTQLGLAHVVEHMAFNGTRSFEKQEIVRYLESVGTRFGADLNAYTSFDETVYELTVPVDSAGILERGLEILAEWAHAVTFDSAEVERERPVVLEEWRVGQGAGARIRAIQFPVLFAGSLYADRLPIGTERSLRTFTHADLVRFYRDWYRPELMAVVAVGDFDADSVVSLVRQAFESLPARTGPERFVAEVPGVDSTRFTIATDPEATGTSVNVLWMHPPDSVHTEQDYRRRLLHALYGNMLDARFGEIAQRPGAPFLGASNSYGSLVPARHAYALGASVSDTGVVIGLEALLVEAERVARHGFTRGEMERAKAGIMRSVELAFAEREKTSSGVFTSAYVSAFLDGEPVTDVATDLELHQRLLPGITMDELNALARHWTRTDDRVVLVTAPRRTDVTIPGVDELRAAFVRVQRTEIEPWDDVVSESPLIAAIPGPGRVAGERVHEGTGITEWTLSNGARVLLKPTDFRDDEIHFRAWSPGGASLVPDSLVISASFATSIVLLGGLGEFDLPQLEKALAGTAASVSPAIGPLEESMGGSAASRDLELMFQLAHLYFTAPREDSSAYVSLRQRLMPILENRGRSPESAFSDTLQVTLAQGHPRSRPLTPSRLDELDMDAALRIYRDRFSSAGDFTFALVGSFEVDSVRPLIEQWIASLPDDGRRESARDVGVRPPEGVVRKVVRRGSEPRATTQIVITGPAEYSQEHQLELSALGELLNIRLREALREDLGGTYGAGVNTGLQREPYEAFSVAIGFGSAPERVDELTDVVFAHLDSLRSVPPSEDEVATVRTMMLRSRETALRQNGFWLSQIAFYDRVGLPFQGILEGDARIRALTPERVQAAAKRYLSNPDYVQVTLLPETDG